MIQKSQEVQHFRENAQLISFLYPAQNKALIEELAKRKATLFAMDCIPRISRAQVTHFYKASQFTEN